MKQERVSDWMTREVIPITPEISLKEAHNIMNAKGIRRLPVAIHNKVPGIVTLRDIRGAELSMASSLRVWALNDLLQSKGIDFVIHCR